MQVKMRMLGNTNLIKVFSIAILAACSVQAGIPLDPDNLDQAWLAALALAHEAGMNHGRDIVFTYGPLGYTHPYQAYLPSPFSSYITGHLLVTAIQCIVIACAAASVAARSVGGRHCGCDKCRGNVRELSYRDARDSGRKDYPRGSPPF